MRVLFVSHSASLTGAPISCFNLIKRLPEGLEAVFASKEPGPLFERLSAINVPTFTLGSKGPLGMGYVKDFIDIIRRERIDLLHLNTLTPFSKYAAIAGATMGKPIVWFVRENPLISRSRRLRPWLRKLATRIVFVDSTTMGQLFDERPPEHASVVHNGVDLEAFTHYQSTYLNTRFALPSGTALVGYIGQITERKGVEYLVRAMPEVLKHHPEAHLVMIGGHNADEGYYETVLRKIKELSLEAHIHLTGSLDDIRPALWGLDIVVLPSLEERCSRTLIEALAAARPTVATSAGGNPELVQHEHNGLLVEPKDASAISSALLRLLDDAALRADMGRKGRLKAEQEFDIAKNTARIITIYREAARG